MKDKIIRIKLSTYYRIRKAFPANREESASSYFERLSKFLEGIKEGYF